MPITYQRLGNSGGGMVLTIHALPNKDVTLTSDKYTATKTTDETGKVVFKPLKAGRYTATTSGENGSQQQIEVVILTEYEEYMPVGQIKDLPLGAKIKLSNGKKFYLKSKGSSGHENNTSIFISEYATEQVAQKAGVFGQDLYSKIFPKYYQELTLVEKSAIVTRSVKKNLRYMGGDGGRYEYHSLYEDVTQFYVLSEKELGLGKRPKEYSDLGFADYYDRIARNEEGEVVSYWLSNSFRDAYYRYALYAVGTAGQWESVSVGDTDSGISASRWIVPCCDFKNDAYVGIDSDGYYRILGM